MLAIRDRTDQLDNKDIAKNERNDNVEIILTVLDVVSFENIQLFKISDPKP